MDVTQWYNWTAFDIIGDLTFGEPFDGLEKGQYHPWVTIIFESMIALGKVTVLSRFEYIGTLLSMLFIPRSLVRKAQEHKELSTHKVEKRLALEEERADLLGKMISGSRKMCSVSLPPPTHTFCLFTVTFKTGLQHVQTYNKIGREYLN